MALHAPVVVVVVVVVVHRPSSIMLSKVQHEHAPFAFDKFLTAPFYAPLLSSPARQAGFYVCVKKVVDVKMFYVDVNTT